MQVSSGFIRKRKQTYEQQQVEGLRLEHKKPVGYLNSEQRQAVLEWLEQKNCWDLQELQTYIDKHYEAVFQSN